MSAIKTIPQNVVVSNTWSIMSWLTDIRKMWTDPNVYEFKYKFDTRNKREATKPFLDSLSVDYIILSDELIVLKLDIALDDKLKKLGFVSTSSICPSTKEFQRILSFTNKLFEDRIYQFEYNFELYLVEPCDWDKVNLAKNITASLRPKENQFLYTFIKVYKEIKNFK